MRSYELPKIRRLLLLLCLVSPLAMGGCDDDDPAPPDGGYVDADSDGESDGDGDTDADGDGDSDADGDADGDTDSDADRELRCGDGVVDPGEECEPGQSRSCTTGCGTSGVEVCDGECRWGACARPEREPTLDDFWEGRARWQYVRRLTAATISPPVIGGGVHFEVREGVWYLFARNVHDPGHMPYCGHINGAWGTEVRASYDQGATWTAPTATVIPVEGTAWECMGTDGDAWYDAEGDRWHYLFQCIDRDLEWRGCHLERAGADPMGPFVETADNPVVEPRELWGEICDDPGDDCVSIPGRAGRVFDEGTFNIFDRRDGWYFVNFHGYDGVNGYRGIAKTPDFQTWVAGDPSQGVPADAIFDRGDATGWRERWEGGSIGGGAGSMFRDGDLYYLLVEAADINLGCTPGQRWDFGLLRSASLTSTSWDQLPAGNPIIYSSTALEHTSGQCMPCNVQYAGVFRDPDDGSLWLHYSRLSTDRAGDGIYLSRLVWESNLLRNGDLQTCDTTGWIVYPLGPTNLVVYRHPNESPDGTCFLATNCGGACEPGQSVSQDVEVSELGTIGLRFGGTVRVEAGAGDLNLVIHQLDAAGEVVTSSELRVHATTTYQSLSGELTLDERTVTARFQLYLVSPATFWIDDLFVTPTGEGC